MAGLFSSPKVKMPPPPKPTRMPVETDPSIVEAGKRARARAGSRFATIMTDSLRQTAGTSSRQKLGA
jgi:hypothetical protein